MQLSEYSPCLSRQLQPFSSPSPSEEPILDVLRDVVSAIEDEVTQYREAFTQSFVDTARERCPHMNALAICTPHGAFPNTRRRICPSSTPRFLTPVISSSLELSLAAATAVLRTSASYTRSEMSSISPISSVRNSPNPYPSPLPSNSHPSIHQCPFLNFARSSTSFPSS